MLVLQNLISEAIPSQKCHMNMGSILSSYGDMDIWNVACVSRCVHVHRQASAAGALLIANSAVRLCSNTCHWNIKLWMSDRWHLC